MADYKSNKLSLFKKIVNSILRKRYKHKDIYTIERERINLLITSYGTKFYGKLLFEVADQLQLNIDELCEQLFYDYIHDYIYAESKHASKLDQFISLFTNSERKLAEAASIDKGRLNRVKNNENEDLFSFEVYGLAKVLGFTPSSVFHYLYGERNDWCLILQLKNSIDSLPSIPPQNQ